MSASMPAPVEGPGPAAAPGEVVLVLTTLPDAEAAERIARRLVEQRLAACVSVLPACTSVYRWQGEVTSATEVLLLIKTSRARYPVLQAGLRQLHPYELPEIVAIDAAAGLPDYLAWVVGETFAEDAGSFITDRDQK